MAKKVSKRWTEDDARRVLDEVDRSGLSDKAYANRYGLKPHRLWWWHRRLEPVRGEDATVAFVEVRSTPARTPQPIEVRLANGRVVSLTTAVDPVVLADLLDAIEGQRC